MRQNGLIVTLQTSGALLENMDLERVPGIFEQTLAGYAGQIDPEGLTAERDQATAFAEGFKGPEVTQPVVAAGSFTCAAVSFIVPDESFRFSVVKNLPLDGSQARD